MSEYPSGTTPDWHPLNEVAEKEAVDFLAGHFWNGDLWHPRHIDLNRDGSFVYTQRVEDHRIIPRGIVEIGTSSDRYSALARSLEWTIRGRWFFASANHYIIRLEIHEAVLIDTNESLPDDAFLELQVLHDTDVILNGELVQKPKRSDLKDELKLEPMDHAHRSPSHFDGGHNERWPHFSRTLTGLHLIRQ